MAIRKTALRKLTALLLCLALCLSLTGCSGGASSTRDAVPVQLVSMLMGLDLSGANRFCGVSEPKSTEKVKKDANKDIAEVKVEVGQEVKKGDVLFTYDLESVRLSVESARLEVEQLSNSITSFDSEIKELERDKRNAPKSQKLSYTLQIQEAMLDKAEAEYNLKKKEKELAKLEKAAKQTKVKAKVDGVIQSIDQSGLTGDGDSGGSDDAFLTIVETGTYRVKGSATETNIANLYQGLPVTVYSRTDYTQQWTGVVSSIDTGSTESSGSDSGSDSDFGSDGDSNDESTSRYSFYVQLDSSDGMMMGQHVYIMAGQFEQGTGVSLNSSFVEQDGEDAWVWAASGKDTLERRAVKLGEYDPERDLYPILEGLTVEDYVAPVAPGLSEGRSVVKYDSESFGEGDADSSLYEDDFGVDSSTDWAEDSMDWAEESLYENAGMTGLGGAFAENAEDYADDEAIEAGEG